MKKKSFKINLIKYLLVALLLVIDLLTKQLAVKFLKDKETIEIIGSILDLQYLENTGASLGIFSDKTLALTIFSGVFILGIMLYDIFCGDKELLYLISYIMLLAGATGNFVDRVCFSFVRDFIGMFGWYVCNFADILICIGLVLFAIYCIFGNKGSKDKCKK